ncbi:MAG: hypothetical protein NUV69_04730 [Candidatus Curtissbacteria bacterium]|nr:hypothetical protein [Candidatus Curtissbacteria bacterium]
MKKMLDDKKQQQQDETAGDMTDEEWQGDTGIAGGMSGDYFEEDQSTEEDANV